MRRFNLPRLIGITGRAGTGKDTLADYLVRQHGYTKYSISSPIKKLLNERFGWTDDTWDMRTFKEAGHPQCGYREGGRAPQYFSPREWAQWLGTEAGRMVHGEDCWVNLMEREWFRLNDDFDSMEFGGIEDPTAEPPAMVVPDVRFDNEAQRVLALGGVVIRIERPDAAPVTAHVSERGVRDELVNVRVVNDTDIITFLRNCVYALETCPRGV